MQAQRPPMEHDPKKIAQMQTDMLDKELSLTKKQRKKVYKLYLKQAREMQTEMRAGRPGMAPPMMGGGGGRGPGSMGGGRGPEVDRAWVIDNKLLLTEIGQMTPARCLMKNK